MNEDKKEKISLADAAYQKIEEMIVTRQLKPGASISEKRIAEDIGYGRTPVREAIQRLRLEGYIENLNRGNQVSRIDIIGQFELLEIRRPIENLMVRLACERATHEERKIMARLSNVLAAAAKKRDRKAYLKANRLIHQTLANASRNSVLVSTLESIHGISRHSWYTMIEEEGLSEEAAQFYGRTLNATVERNTDAATKYAAEFLDFLERLTRKKLNEHISGI